MSWNRLERVSAVTKFPCEPLTFINTRDSFLSDLKFTFLIWLVASFSCIGRGLLFCREKPGLLLSNWPCFFPQILSHGLQKLWGQWKVIFLCTVLAEIATLEVLAGLKSGWNTLGFQWGQSFTELFLQDDVPHKEEVYMRAKILWTSEKTGSLDSLKSVFGHCGIICMAFKFLHNITLMVLADAGQEITLIWSYSLPVLPSWSLQ